MSSNQTIFQLGFEISPIILVDGIAAGVPGGMLPIVALTEASNFVSGLLQGSIDGDLNNYFAHFSPVPGGQLVSNQIGQYPFANQTVAANAIVSNPLNLTMLMKCPVNRPGGYVSKLVTITALQNTLQKHIFAGGTFTVATPSYVYENMLLLELKDVTSGESKQVQTEWEFVFQQPLIAIADANLVMNSLMSKIAGGLPQNGAPAWSSPGNAVAGVMTGASNLVGMATSAVTSAVSSPSVSVSQI